MEGSTMVDTARPDLHVFVVHPFLSPERWKPTSAGAPRARRRRGRQPARGRAARPVAAVLARGRAPPWRPRLRRGRRHPSRPASGRGSLLDSVSKTHEDLPRPQPRQRRRVHVLRPRQGQGRPGDLEVTHVLTDIETLNQRGQGGQARGHGDLVPRLPLRGRQVRPHALRRQHRRRLRAAARGARAAATARRIAELERGRARHPDLGLPRPEALRARACAPASCPSTRSSTRCGTGRADVGLIIHEGQLTFGGHGLHKVLDLGVWWKQETGLPLPLGGNAVRRDLGPELMARLTGLVRETVRYSLAHRKEALEYAMTFARGMDPGDRRPLRGDVGQRHDGGDGRARAAGGADASSTAATRPASFPSAWSSTSWRPERGRSVDAGAFPRLALPDLDGRRRDRSRASGRRARP